MKQSGIDWIGEIPDGWEVRKIRTIANIIRGGSPRPIDEFMTNSESGFNWIKIGDTVKGSKYITSTKAKIIKEGLSKTRIVNPGDLILTNSMSFGEPYILKINGCIHDGWVAFSQIIKSVNKEFLYYFLRSSFCNTQFQLQVDGGVVQNLNIDKIKSTTLFLPPLSEQESIVKMLDSKCEQIDSIIEESKKSIEEYKAWKQSVIFEAVTGKNLTCKKKDSGIDTVGMIPVEWELRRLRFLCDIMTGDQDTQDANPDGKYNFYVRSPNVEKSDSYTFEGEGILMAGDGAGAGKVFHHAYGKYAIHQRVYCFYNFRDINTNFFYYYISLLFSIDMEKGSAQSTVPSVRMPMIKDFTFCLPPLPEQESIAKMLDSKCAQIDSLVAEKESLIQDLTEYKKSLIFEVVTGKRSI